MITTTKTNKQPKLYSIYKFQPSGQWVHSSYILSRSAAHITKSHPQHNNKSTLICEAK